MIMPPFPQGSLALALGEIRTPAPQAVCGRRHHQMVSPSARPGLHYGRPLRGLYSVAAPPPGGGGGIPRPL